MSNSETLFASPERKPMSEVLKMHRVISSNSGVKTILEALPHIVLILNEDRQIVHANTTLLSVLGISNINDIMAQRPGEVIHCIHADEGPNGCGTSRNCSLCGAVLAVIESQQSGEPVSKEAHLTSVMNDQEVAWNLLVVASPVIISDENFTIVSMVDISTDKRKSYLERIFFHDVLNTSSIILGYEELLQDSVSGDVLEMVQVLKDTTLHLIDEIQAQRELSNAETGELSVHPTELIPGDILQSLKERYVVDSIENGISVEVIDHYGARAIVTDKVLLVRVLNNLLKNGVEASSSGMTVTISCWEDAGYVNFSCQNESFMSDEVRMQIFSRNFSTKGKNRGLGTYSVKLLTERYLKGVVSFVTDEGFGTIFYITIPKVYPEK